MRSQALAAMQGEHAALGAALDEIKKRKQAAKKAVAALTNEQRKAKTRCAPRTCRVFFQQKRDWRLYACAFHAHDMPFVV